MSDIAEDVAEERRQIDDMLSPVKVKVKASHVGAPSLDGDSGEQVAASPCPSCSKVGAEVPLGGAGFHPSCGLCLPAFGLRLLSPVRLQLQSSPYAVHERLTRLTGSTCRCLFIE